MDCNSYREAISARIDGEDTGLETEAVDSHLAACPPCRSWSETATAVTRLARVGPADAVPDLTLRIMAAISAPARRAVPSRGSAPPTGRQVASPGMVARLGLLMVALAQGCVAVPALLGSDAGAPIHVAHEQGSWSLALAVGLLVVVARPGRAASMLALVAALAGGLALTMVVDIAAGRTQAAAEAPHCLAFLGLGLLWVLAREARVAAPGTPRTHAPSGPGREMARAA